jgi:5-methyltetrahydrofolate corrinoid/iron sulfur protein methyltransferase
MSAKTGIPKSADERRELVIKIYEKCIEKGIAPEKLFFDPLIIPVKFDSSQVFEALNTISMINESFEKQVNSIIGLSNVSNGALKNLRPLLNRVYFVLAFGAGLTSAIIDANDGELFRIAQMLECNNPQNEIDKLYINISNMIQCFGDVEDIVYNKNNNEQQNIMKTLKILSGQEVFSGNYMQL